MLDEIWAIQCKQSANLKCRFVPPIDDDGTDVFLAWALKNDAEIGLAHQVEMGFFDPAEVEIVCLFSMNPEPASVAGGGG